jgi:predicted RNA-binding protein with PUA-like domain
VRNYQARNFMREMKYRRPRAFSITRAVRSRASPALPRSPSSPIRRSQFDRKGKYFDAKATRENPRWFNVDVTLVEKTRLISIAECAMSRSWRTWITLRRGNRAIDHAGDRRRMEGVVKLARRSPDGLNFALLPIFLALGAFVGFLAGLLGIGGGFHASFPC